MSHIVVHPRILMVDNDKRAIEALTALLSKALPNAYVADDVTDGTKALSLCRAYGNQYDIILLDMSLEDQTSANVYASSTIARPFWP